MSSASLSALDHQALAERLVQQMRLQPGEKVLLLSRPGGYVRWNLFTDATVTVGGQVWVRDGKLAVR